MREHLLSIWPRISSGPEGKEIAAMDIIKARRRAASGVLEWFYDLCLDEAQLPSVTRWPVGTETGCHVPSSCEEDMPSWMTEPGRHPSNTLGGRAA